MDKLIGSFVKEKINKFNTSQLQELEKFLSIDDDTLSESIMIKLNHLK